MPVQHIPHLTAVIHTAKIRSHHRKHRKQLFRLFQLRIIDPDIAPQFSPVHQRKSNQHLHTFHMKTVVNNRILMPEFFHITDHHRASLTKCLMVLRDPVDRYHPLIRSRKGEVFPPVFKASLIGIPVDDRKYQYPVRICTVCHQFQKFLKRFCPVPVSVFFIFSEHNRLLHQTGKCILIFSSFAVHFSTFLVLLIYLFFRVISAIVCIIFSSSIGFARCASIPALVHYSISSRNAFAVRAMIGIFLPSSLCEARIFRVASSPSITGIITSIRITSYVPSGLSSNIRTAS